MSILVIGHWLSANLGDKYQPYIVYDSLIKNSKEKIQCVNFSSDGDKLMWFEISSEQINVKLEIIGPEEIKPGFHTAIITTGSMNFNSPYVPWVIKIIEQNPESTIIFWGGFSRGYTTEEEYSQSLSFLRHSNVFYYARTEMDLILYRTIVNNTSRGIYAGDPICQWITKTKLKTNSEFGRTPALAREVSKFSLFPGGTIVIASIHCFEYDRGILWDQICRKADYILCLDTYADEPIRQKYSNVVICNEPLRVIEYLAESKHVISGRLHGAILSATMGIPATMIQIDCPEKGKGSYKFEAFGDICRLLHPEKTTIDEIFTVPDVKKESVDFLIQTTKQTLSNFSKNL